MVSSIGGETDGDRFLSSRLAKSGRAGYHPFIGVGRIGWVVRLNYGCIRMAAVANGGRAADLDSIILAV